MSTILSAIQAIFYVIVLSIETFALQIVLFTTAWVAVYVYRRNINKLGTQTKLIWILDKVLFGFAVAAVFAIVLWILGIIALGAAIKADAGVSKSKGMQFWTDQYQK